MTRVSKSAESVWISSGLQYDIVIERLNNAIKTIGMRMNLKETKSMINLLLSRKISIENDQLTNWTKFNPIFSQLKPLFLLILLDIMRKGQDLTKLIYKETQLNYFSQVMINISYSSPRIIFINKSSRFHFRLYKGWTGLQEFFSFYLTSTFQLVLLWIIYKSTKLLMMWISTQHISKQLFHKGGHSEVIDKF